MSGGTSSQIKNPAPGQYNGVDTGFTTLPTGQPDFSNFTNSAQGQSYAQQIAANAANGYSYYGNSKTGGYTAANTADYGGEYNNADATGLMTAYEAWANEQASAQSGWASYADLVAKEGGSNASEGTRTILSGSETTPYQSILAAQAGLGNPTLVNTVTRPANGKIGAT